MVYPLRMRTFLLRNYVNLEDGVRSISWVWYVASLPATFSTLERGPPNMIVQATLTRVNLGHVIEWAAGGWVSKKGKASLGFYLTR